MLENDINVNLTQEQINSAVANFMNKKFNSNQLKDMVQTVNTHDSYSIKNIPATNKYDFIGKVIGDICAAATFVSMAAASVKITATLCKYNKTKQEKKED